MLVNRRGLCVRYSGKRVQRRHLSYSLFVPLCLYSTWVLLIAIVTGRDRRTWYLSIGFGRRGCVVPRGHAHELVERDGWGPRTGWRYHHRGY